MINHASINGMRGCYLSTDYEDKYLLVAGYHDGKLTVLRLKRVREGRLALDRTLKPGSWRELTGQEILLLANEGNGEPL